MDFAQPPVALTIAGSDCSAGAGLQADLKAFSACGVYGVTAVTALVAETPQTVARVDPQLSEIVAEQVRILTATFPIAAAKTGLLATAEIVRAVGEILEKSQFPLVVDPISVASTGDSLTGRGFEAALRNFVENRATLLTPNRGEAEKWLGRAIETTTHAEDAAADLAANLGCAVLLKGGHFEGRDCVDFLAHGGKTEAISGVRVPEGDVHGTGCTYSAAITARLAQGFDLAEAVRLARRYLHETLAAAYVWPDAGQGEGGIKALAHFARSADSPEVTNS